jgi:hypothetical protein
MTRAFTMILNIKSTKKKISVHQFIHITFFLTPP